MEEAEISIRELWESLPSSEGEDRARILLELSADAVHRSSGRKALALAEEAEVIYRGLGAKVPSASVAEAVEGVGKALLVLKRFNEAVNVYMDAIQLQKENNFAFLSDTYRTLGNIYFKLENYIEALENYLRSLAINEVDGDEEFMALDFYNAGRSCFKLKDFRKAVEYLECAKLLEKERKALDDVARVEYLLGDSYLAQGMIELAEKSAQNAYAIAELRKDNDLLCKGSFLKAKVLQAQGNFEAVLDELSQADYLASCGNDWELILEIQNEFRMYYVNTNQFAEAERVAARIATIREILE